MSNSPYSGAALKRSAMHFLAGKAASALLTFGILLWLVRLLDVEEYGTYVALVAGMELGLAITQIGLPWVAARYLPEFRLHASGQQLEKFALQIIARICLYAITGALLLFVSLPWLLAPLKLAQHADVARLYLLVMMAEGLRRNLQECILEPLLQQGHAQFSQVMRNLVLLICLGIIAVQGAVHLHHVVLAELTGTLVGTGFALRGLVKYLRTHRHLPGDASWQPPKWAKMRRTALHMYFSLLITLAYSQQVFIFLTQHFLGVETTALLGFLLNLYGQICRYLPATLLFGLIRPKLIASYVGEGGMAQLMGNANLVGKLSLFVLMPLLVFAWLAGDELLSLLSAHKFTQAGSYFGCLLLVLIPFSQRLILETVVVASGHSHFCSWGSSLAVLTLPLAYWLLESGQGLWGPILAMMASQILYNATLSAAMAATTAYRPDAAGLFRLSAAALVGYGLCIFARMAWVGSFQLQVNESVGLFGNAQAFFYALFAQEIERPVQGWLGLTVMAALSLGLFLLMSFFFKPFRVEERLRLNRLLGYKSR